MLSSSPGDVTGEVIACVLFEVRTAPLLTLKDPPSPIVTAGGDPPSLASTRVSGSERVSSLVALVRPSSRVLDRDEAPVDGRWRSSRMEWSLASSYFGRRSPSRRHSLSAVRILSSSRW